MTHIYIYIYVAKIELGFCIESIHIFFIHLYWWDRYFSWIWRWRLIKTQINFYFTPIRLTSSIESAWNIKSVLSANKNLLFCDIWCITILWCWHLLLPIYGINLGREMRDAFILSHLKYTNYSTWECKVTDFRSGNGDSHNSAITAFVGRLTSGSQSTVAWPPWWKNQKTSIKLG